MNRRHYLETSLGIATAALAGCSAVVEETTLEAPSETRVDHSIRFVYEADGEDILHVNFNTQPDTSWKEVNEQPKSPALHRLRTRMTPNGDASLDRYRVRFKSPAEENAAANIYLHPPLLGHEDVFDTYREDGWTVFEAEYDGGTPVTSGFEVLVYSDVDAATAIPSLLVDYELTLSGEGYIADTFVAQDRTTLDLESSE